MNLRLGSIVATVLGIVCFAAPAFAQSQPLTLAWDPNPEPSVAGYVVYVGSASRSYEEWYDVGNQTSFAYPAAVTGRPYYFAVAAYAPASGIGALSEEVFFRAGVVSASSDGGSIAPAQSSAIMARPFLCAGDRGAACYDVTPLASIGGHASSLTPLHDGRVLFVEDARRIRIIDGAALLSEPALQPRSPSTQIAGLVVHPDFARNRFLYVGEIDTTAGGGRELRIVRYREMANILAEGAAIVTGLPLPSSGGAPFTIDSAGRIYVAVPAEPNSYRDTSPYAGMVLRFENDGSVRRDSPAGSPVFARGYSQPASLIWNEPWNELWLAGSGAEWSGPLARLSLTQDLDRWPAIPRDATLLTESAIVHLGASPVAGRASMNQAPANVIVVDENGAVFSIIADAAGVTAAEQLSTNDLGGAATSAALHTEGVRNEIYLALTVETRDSDPSSQILRLRRR